MSWPDPRPGLVIRYSYLWRREALEGREEGVKDRPCAIVLAIKNDGEEATVYVLPITHVAPSRPEEAVELPGPTKARLGLDAERSWVVVTEGNSFVWPGPDLRFVQGEGADSIAYGRLPPAVFSAVRARFLDFVRTRRSGIVKRTE
ncbi:MAG: growth inhibitor PemK [Caulobacteraceae bacterium]|nr:growth inhibitor PemK [Caulobacteraceae bacterium]